MKIYIHVNLLFPINILSAIIVKNNNKCSKKKEFLINNNAFVTKRVVDNFDSYKWLNKLQLFYNIYNYFRKVYIFIIVKK